MSERHLDPKVKLLWFAPNAALALLVTLVLMGIYYATRFTFGIFSEPNDLMYLVIFISSLGIIGGLSYTWIHLHYVSFTYELTEAEVVIRWGVFTRLRKVIPYTRIQNINTERTVIERILGIGSVMIETAGTQTGLAEGIIPGIANPTGLIDEILHRVQTTKKENGNNGGLGEAGAKKDNYSDILQNIYEELKTLNKSVNDLSAKKEVFENISEIHDVSRNKGRTEMIAGEGTDSQIQNEIEMLRELDAGDKTAVKAGPKRNKPQNRKNLRLGMRKRKD